MARQDVDGVEERLDDTMQPVRARLEVDLRRVAPEALAATPKPQAINKLAKYFNAKTRRRPYPSSFTFHLDALALGAPDALS